VNRGLALLLAIAGGAVFAFAIVTAGTVALAGVLWLFVFGDNSWPSWVSAGLDIAIPVTGLALWALASWTLFIRLKRN
jgi:hypothetical protein